MKKKNDYCEPVNIRQEENGYVLEVGFRPNECSKKRFVFQSFTELVCFLNDHFTYRNENIFADFNSQLSISLKQK